MFGLHPRYQALGVRNVEATLLMEGDQDRTHDVPCHPARPDRRGHRRSVGAKAARQERTLVHIPQAGIAGRSRLTLIESDGARNEGRSPFIGNDGDPVLVDIVSLAQIIHCASDRLFELPSAYDVGESVPLACAQQINGQQRKSALRRKACEP